MIFAKRYRYRFGDIDDAGIAYYPALFHYFHCGFEDWWYDALGVPYPKVLQEEKFGLPAVHIATDFYRPIRYGDEPWFHLGVLQIGESSVHFGFWLADAEHGKPFCRARVITAGIHMDTIQKQPVPEKWRKAFQPYVIREGEFPTKG